MNFTAHYLNFIAELKKSVSQLYLSNVIETYEALPHFSMLNLKEVRLILRALLIKQKEDYPLFNEIFDTFFVRNSIKSVISDSIPPSVSPEPELETFDEQEFASKLNELEQNENLLQRMEDQEINEQLQDAVSDPPKSFEDLMEQVEDIERMKEEFKKHSEKEKKKEQEKQEKELKEKIGTEELADLIKESFGEEMLHGGEELHLEVPEGEEGEGVLEGIGDMPMHPKPKPSKAPSPRKALDQMKEILDKAGKGAKPTPAMRGQMSDFREKFENELQEIEKQIRNQDEPLDLLREANQLRESLESLEKALDSLLKETLQEKVKEQLIPSGLQSFLDPSPYLKQRINKELEQKLRSEPDFCFTDFILQMNDFHGISDFTDDDEIMELYKIRMEETHELFKEIKKALEKERLEEILKKRYTQEEMEKLQNKALERIDQDEMDYLRKNIMTYLQKLELRKSLRMKRYKKGRLDMKATARSFMAGKRNFIYTKPKLKHLKRLILLLDVSGSIAWCVPYLLLIISCFDELIRDKRYFFFIDEAMEVTQYLEKMDRDQLLLLDDNEMWKEFEYHTTDPYSDIGAGIQSFYHEVENDLRRDDLVLIFSDARNNFRDEDGLHALKELNEKTDHLYWLNPEKQSDWGTGDSEMLTYKRHVRSHSITTFNLLYYFFESLIKK